jgi:hypothetical protein
MYIQCSPLLDYLIDLGNTPREIEIKIQERQTNVCSAIVGIPVAAAIVSPRSITMERSQNRFPEISDQLGQVKMIGNK